MMIAGNKVQGSINGLSVSAVPVWIIYYRILKDTVFFFNRMIFFRSDTLKVLRTNNLHRRVLKKFNIILLNYNDIHVYVCSSH